MTAEGEENNQIEIFIEATKQKINGTIKKVSQKKVNNLLMSSCLVELLGAHTIEPMAEEVYVNFGDGVSRCCAVKRCGCDFVELDGIDLHK